MPALGAYTAAMPAAFILAAVMLLDVALALAFVVCTMPTLVVLLVGACATKKLGGLLHARKA